MVTKLGAKTKWQETRRTRIQVKRMGNLNLSCLSEISMKERKMRVSDEKERGVMMVKERTSFDVM